MNIQANENVETIQREIKHCNRIIYALSDLLWFKDLNGLLLGCNQRFEEFLGISEQEACCQTGDELINAKLAHVLKNNHQQAIHQQTAITTEEWFTFANDEHRELLEITQSPIFDSHGQLIGVLGVGHDITAWRESEQKLKRSEERFSLAMKGANDGLWDWDLETNHVYYSPRWKSMLGYSNDELEHTLHTWSSLVHSEDKGRVLDLVQDYILGKRQSFETEMRMHHKDGHDVFILSRAFLVRREADAKPIRLVGTHVDISPRKQAEAFDAKHAEILEMIATGEPASKIYHEIAVFYESRHPGLRCSMLELKDGKLMHGGAPSLPQEYCDAVHGLQNGPSVGSCGTSTYTGERVLVEDINTDPKWANIKHIALPYGMRCCWSEPIKDSSGRVLGAFGMYYNHPALPNEMESSDLKSAARIAGIVMERDQAQKRIQELAYFDELTGLASRAYFYLNLEQCIRVADRREEQLSLLYIDLDDFKSVNDSLGHDAGDILLKEIAQRLRQVTRESDFVARLSGDEFCILVQSTNLSQTPSDIAQRCLKVISKPIELSGRKFTPACSIGIANYPHDGGTPAILIKAADTSLYAAKERGKNQYVYYQPDFSRQAEYRFRLEQHLREAVEQQQLFLVYQPQVEITTGKLTGIETLARWHHPQLGNISPSDFIPIAENIGMIKALTEWVLKTACTQVVQWQRSGVAIPRIAVNISPIHCLDQDFVCLVKDVLAQTGIDPATLELEVTESLVQTDDQNLAIFSDLKELGVLLTIDDFGTGYSSFASLKHLTIDGIKIDKYFIDDMIDDHKSQVLVRSMIQMGCDLDYEIIAEGVETHEQAHMLLEFGCDRAQGYLFSKPVSASQIPQIINAHHTTQLLTT